MALIASELGQLFHPGVKWKKNKTKNLRSTAKRVAGGAPEVMVKITGFGKGAGHVKAHLDYITRNGKLELENELGQVFNGKEEVKTLFKDWENNFEKSFEDSKRHKARRDTMHLVLSMPENTDPESVKRATREFAKSTFGKNHEYVFALHTDEPHPHCHVTVKCLGLDGKRLNPRKADLQQWREGFADKLRDQGVDAEATPRNSRGVVRKAEPNIIRHIERGDNTHKPRVSKVMAAKIKEIAQELTDSSQGLPIPPKPWEEVIKSKQKKVRRAWLSVADALEHKTKITFNQKEAHNERPQYDRISEEHIRRGQRAAVLYQSGLEDYGRNEPPRSVASLRNMPVINVVHNERAATVLLRSDALNRMGPEQPGDSEMRREGVGADPTQSEAKALMGRGEVEDNKLFAAQIRSFVKAMPSIDTERHQIKNDLVQRFTKHAESIHVAIDEAVVQPSGSKEKGINHATGMSGERKDIDR